MEETGASQHMRDARITTTVYRGDAPQRGSGAVHHVALECGDYPAWHRYTTDQIEDSGQHEVLNWFCLLGAMEALGRKPDKATFIETWAFVSPVVFAYYNA